MICTHTLSCAHSHFYFDLLLFQYARILISFLAHKHKHTHTHALNTFPSTLPVLSLHARSHDYHRIFFCMRIFHEHSLCFVCFLLLLLLVLVVFFFLYLCAAYRFFFRHQRFGVSATARWTPSV